MPIVQVGHEEVQVKWQEYYAAMLPEGTPVSFSDGKRSGTGIFLGSYFYDGVVARIAVGDDAVSVFVGLGGRVRRLRDAALLAGSNCGGDGI